jgi:aspartyl-tRNA(Asn)/glutamyl-tRNA(Gln) amidotransferase subunit A
MINKSAAEMAAALTAGEITSVELTQAHLDQIAKVDSEVHAFLHVDREGALSQARDVDGKRKSGEKMSPLSGVPLALKVYSHKKEFLLPADRKCLKVGVRRMTPLL